MAKIDDHSISLSIKTNSVEPAISVGLPIQKDWNEVITNIDVRAYSEDKKLLGFLLPDVPPSTRPGDNKEQSIFLYYNLPQNNEMGESTTPYYFTLILPKRIIDHIEKVRHSNPLNDVVLDLDVQVRYQKYFAGLGKYQRYVFSQGFPAAITFPAANQGSDPSIKILTLLDQQNVTGSSLFEVRNDHEQLKITIPMSKWVKEYLPPLDYGNYFIVEFPAGEKDISDAWRNIDEAEKAYRQWNISGVFSSCRLAGQALDRIIKDRFGEGSFTYTQRWGRIYGIKNGGFDHWTSMPLHQEDIKGEGTGSRKYQEEEIKATESDAEAMLFTIMVLAKYAEKLLKENPEKG